MHAWCWFVLIEIVGRWRSMTAFAAVQRSQRADPVARASRPGMPAAAAWPVHHAGRRQRLRPGQPRHPAPDKLARRLPPVLPGQPQAVPDHRRVRARRPPHPHAGSRHRHPHRRAALPRCGATASWSRRPTEVSQLWRDDLVSFVIGCSFSFEEALLEDGLPKSATSSVQPALCRCTAPPSPACRRGPFVGPMVVSMRPLRPADAIRAVQITSRFPSVHGAPVHLGHPQVIGIADINKPDYGDAVPIGADEMPVFWACGVTPQAAIAPRAAVLRSRTSPDRCWSPICATKSLPRFDCPNCLPCIEALLQPSRLFHR